MDVKELRPGVFEVESMEDVDLEEFLKSLEEEAEKPSTLEGDDDGPAVAKA